MSNDLGRELLTWAPDKWDQLDTLAADTVTGSVIFRNLLDHREEPGAFSVRIGGANVNVQRLPLAPRVINYDTLNPNDEDLKRQIRLAAQDLAVEEDVYVLGSLNIGVLAPPAGDLLSNTFLRVKNQLRGRGVQQGFGVVVSEQAYTDLEREVAGVRSGLEFFEKVIGATVALAHQSVLPVAGHDGTLHGVILQASPGAYQIVHAYGPRVRVTGLAGTIITLEVEEGIAVGELEPNRCIGIRLA